MTDRLMLLDSASLYFRAFYGVPDRFHAPDGTPVNAVRGFLDMIARLVSEFEVTHLVACWDDDWRPEWRVRLIPSYKTHRVAEAVSDGTDAEQIPDPLAVQVPIIVEALALLGIVRAGAAEHEADDVIGTLATGAGIPVDIVTGDRDLFQLVDDSESVRVVYTARGMNRLQLVTESYISEKYGVTAAQYADFAVMRGDVSDGLRGVAGVGEKTAASLLQQYGSLAHIRAAAFDEATAMSATVRGALTVAAEYLDVAPRVVSVVRDLPLEVGDTRLRHPSGESRARLQAFGQRWGLGQSVSRILAVLE